MTTERSARHEVEALDAPAALPSSTVMAAGSMEERLRRLEQRYQALQQAAGQITWNVSADGHALDDSQTWRAFTSQAPRQIHGLGWMEAIHPDDREPLAAAWTEAHAAGNAFEHTMRVRRNDGLYRLLLARGAPVKDASGTIVEWVGVCTDVTEVQTVQQQVAVRTSLLEATFDAMVDPVSVYALEDGAPRLRLANAAYRALSSQARDGAPVTDSTRPEAEPELLDAEGAPLPPEHMPHWRILRGEVLGGAQAMDVQVRLPGAGLRYLSVTGGPVRDAQGAITGAVVVSRDMTERRRLEQEAALRAQELEAIFEAVSESIAVYDAKGHVQRLNPVARERLIGNSGVRLPRSNRERMRRYDLRDAQGEPLPEAVWPLTRILRGEVLSGASSVDLRMRMLDGREGEISVSGAPLRDAEGRITGGVVITHDVTERRRLEREVAARASQLEATYEAMVDGVVILDAEGNIVSANSAARDLLGHKDTAEPIALPLAGGDRAPHLFDEQGHPLAPEDAPGARVLRGEVLRGATAMEVRHSLHDGRTLWYIVSGSPIRDARGAIIGGILLHHEVTERHNLKQRTHESLQALLAMAEALVADPTIVTPEATDTADALPSVQVARRLAELARGVLGCERVGLAVLDTESRYLRPVAAVGLTPEQQAWWWRGTDQRPRFGEGIAPARLARFVAGEPLLLDCSEVPPSGQPNPYGITTALAAPLRIGDRFIGVLALDFGSAPHTYTPEELALALAVARLAALVIERERLLHERAAAEASILALQQAHQRMEQFLGVISHELRTPLTSVKANVQLARRRVDHYAASAPQPIPPQLRMLPLMLERAERQIGRLTRLVNDLVDVARIQQGKLGLRLARCDLRQIVAEAVQEQRLGWPGRELRLRVEREQSYLVDVDADRIEQVVTNFLTNALKYSGEEQPVEVTLSVTDGAARVAVHDRGPGVPQDEQDHIWELFHQVAGTETRDGSLVGLGMGLFISRTIIERHGGAVGVESRVGTGATFWFSLPRALGDDVQPAR
jgi:PAS domain S-box-containing protein